MWKLVDVQIIYKKLYQRELVTSDWFFVIRNSSGVQIFRNDEKVRQRHLPKMYTLVVTMNWNRFRKIFRIRFCIFYNRSELSQCTGNYQTDRYKKQVHFTTRTSILITHNAFIDSIIFEKSVYLLLVLHTKLTSTIYVIQKVQSSIWILCIILKG